MSLMNPDIRLNDFQIKYHRPKYRPYIIKSLKTQNRASKILSHTSKLRKWQVLQPDCMKLSEFRGVLKAYQLSAEYPGNDSETRTN